MNRAGRIMASSDATRLVSKRGSNLPPLPYYITLFSRFSQNIWSPENPGGTMIASVAQSSLSVDLLQAKIKEVEYPLEAFFYEPTFLGVPKLRQALVNLLMSNTIKNTTLVLDNLVLSNGALPILETVGCSIMDPGESIMVLAPFYPAYNLAMTRQVEGKVVPTYCNPDGDVYQQLTQTKNKAEESGSVVRAILVTNPVNPTGEVCSESFLTVIINWAADNLLHVITTSNEIYANSVYETEPNPYISMYDIGRQLDREELKYRLHFVSSLSKNFAPGLRIGMLYTENADVVRQVATANTFSGANHLMMHQLAEVLSNEEFVKSYLEENRRRLKESADILKDALVEAGIQFHPAQAGLFVWIDLKNALKIQDYESEKAICTQLAESGVLVSPGELFMPERPGYFRICFAALDKRALPEVVNRIKNIFQK